jgi:predicted transcriptional regulator
MVFDYRAFAEFMRQRGFDTSAKIAAELGVHKSVISKLENGLQRPSLDFIALIWWKYPKIGARRFLSPVVEGGE